MLPRQESCRLRARQVQAQELVKGCFSHFVWEILSKQLPRLCISCRALGDRLHTPGGRLSMSARTKSVLVVDDGPLVRQKLCEMLTREGDFDLCGEAVNGRDAIEKAQQLRPDLIIMDLSMPVMNGLEAVRILRSVMPSTPIIKFSNYRDRFIEKLALSMGVAAVISKSQHFSILLESARGLFLRRAA